VELSKHYHVIMPFNRGDIIAGRNWIYDVAWDSTFTSSFPKHRFDARIEAAKPILTQSTFSQWVVHQQDSPSGGDIVDAVGGALGQDLKEYLLYTQKGISLPASEQPENAKDLLNWGVQDWMTILDIVNPSKSKKLHVLTSQAGLSINHEASFCTCYEAGFLSNR